MDHLATATSEFVTPQRKCQYLQFVAPYYNLPTLNSLGFDASERSHKTATNWFKNNGNKVSFVPLRQGGNKPNPDLINDIADFCNDNSREAANRYSTKCKAHCRHLDDTIIHLYTEYKCSEYKKFN